MAVYRWVRSARVSSPAIVGLLTLLAAVARFTRLGHQSYWYDESHTVWLVHFSFTKMLSLLPSTETSPPLYFVLAWIWAHLFGYGETALRSLSALAGVATVPVAYLAASRFFSRRTGVIVAALTASSPLLVWYSQEARSYSLMVLLTTCALLAFAHLRQGPTRGWVITWAVAASLAMFTHYYAALAILPQGVWLFVRHRQVRMVRFAVEAVVACCLLLVVLLVRQLIFLGPGTNWINQISLTHRLGELPTTFALGPEAPVGGWLMLAFGVLSLGAVALLLGRADPAERSRATALAGLAVAGAALVGGLIVIGFDQLDSRNVIALWLPLILLLGAGFGARRSGWLGLTGAAACCAIGVVCIVAVGVNPQLERPNWRGLAAALRAQPDRAIFAVDACNLLPLSVYLPNLHDVPSHGASVREVDVLVLPKWSNWYVRCPSSAPTPRVPHEFDGLVQAGRPRIVDEFAVYRFTASKPVWVTPRSLTRTGLHGISVIQ
jgi:mannosyltransferase